MNDELKLIAEQNLINMGLLQYILRYLGVSDKNIKFIMRDVQQKVEKELNQ